MKQANYIIAGILLFGIGYFSGYYFKPAARTQNAAVTASPEQQRQCGIDAREYVKQYSTVWDLIESVYSPKLQDCVAYIRYVDPRSNKIIFDITSNRILAGYSYIKPAPTVSPADDFCKTYGCKPDSGYWIDNKDPGKQPVTQEEFDTYKESLGIQSSL